MKFALITEGASEHRILKHILAKYFKENEPFINQIQPTIVNEKQKSTGGWAEVLKYCKREDDLNEIFINNDYLIIQIDTDRSEQKPFNISHTNQDNTDKSVDELCNNVVEKLRGLISPEIMEEYGNKIFFAVCVHTIECWLLPLFYTDSNRVKTLNCLKPLNTAFRKKKIHIITAENKNEPNGVKAYETALKNWKKKEEIIDTAQHNAGFKKFVESLDVISAEVGDAPISP